MSDLCVSLCFVCSLLFAIMCSTLPDCGCVPLVFRLCFNHVFIGFMMFVFAAFVIIWTFSVSSNRSSADLLPAGCGAYILMPDLNRFVTIADLHNDLLRQQNHTCQFVPLDWSLRQHVSQLQLRAFLVCSSTQKLQL